MAPEILYGRSYFPLCCDLFSCGVILFIMFAGHPPFQYASEKDRWYSHIYEDKHEAFWQMYEQRRPPGFFSPDFKNLISGLLNVNFAFRPSMAEVKHHPWLVNGPVARLEDISVEFTRRLHETQKQKERERQEIRMQRLAKKLQDQNVVSSAQVKPRR